MNKLPKIDRTRLKKKKKKKVQPSDNNSPNRTDYPRETEPRGKKKKALVKEVRRESRQDQFV